MLERLCVLSDQSQATRRSDSQVCRGRRRSAPNVTDLCTVYVLYGYYASATLLSSVDFTKKKKPT